MVAQATLAKLGVCHTYILWKWVRDQFHLFTANRSCDILLGRLIDATDKPVLKVQGLAKLSRS
jgi:thymidylate synthase